MTARLAMRGDVLALADDRALTLWQWREGTAHRIDGVELPFAPTDVATRGAAVLARDRDRGCLWTPSGGIEPLVEAKGPRDGFALGFVDDDEPTILIAQKGRLLGRRLDGRPRFDANLAKPRWLQVGRIIDLGRGRVALHGAEFGDGFDTIIVVALAALDADADAVQGVLARERPFHDRAPRLAIGPACGDTVIAFRDPEEEEPFDPDREIEERPDTWGLHGLYRRDLTTGELSQCVAIDELAPAPHLAASERRVFVATAETLIIVDERGQIAEQREARAVALDPGHERCALWHGDDRFELIAFGQR